MTSPRVTISEVRRFIRESAESSGASEKECNDLADILMAADMRGHYSHGINRLGIYCSDFITGACSTSSSPTIEHETIATAFVNGNNCLGASVGKYCMELAIEKCKVAGVGVVNVKGSNHYGIAGYYGIMAKDKGYIGISMTNTSPVQVPTRAKECTLGSNPIAVIAPATGADYFALDMATSTVALGKLEVAMNKGEEIPPGWGRDSVGQETLQPAEVLQGGGGLAPLGGSESSGGYKGTGLAMMVEVMCGVLGGAAWGPHIRRWNDPTDLTPANLGQFFMALNPDVFGGAGFQERLQQFLDQHRALSPVSGEEAVLAAGDVEQAAEQDCLKHGSIPYHTSILTNMKLFAEKMNVRPMKEE